MIAQEMKPRLLLLALAVLSGQAVAGTDITGAGATEALACWDYERKANAHAKSRNTCYMSCKRDRLRPSGDGFSITINNPNQQGSCDNNKYDRQNPVADGVWVSRNPRPGTPPVSTNNVQTSSSPQRGVNTVNFYPGVPSANYATLIIRNNTNVVGVTDYTIIVGDSGYSHPPRQIAHGRVTLNPGQSWQQQFHQWRAINWELERY